MTMSNERTEGVEVKEAVFKSGKRQGQRYFFAEDNGTVIASENKLDLDVYFAQPNRVRLGDENRGWRWVLGVNPADPSPVTNEKLQENGVDRVFNDDTRAELISVKLRLERLVDSINEFLNR